MKIQQLFEQTIPDQYRDKLFISADFGSTIDAIITDIPGTVSQSQIDKLMHMSLPSHYSWLWSNISYGKIDDMMDNKLTFGQAFEEDEPDYLKVICTWKQFMAYMQDYIDSCDDNDFER